MKDCLVRPTKIATFLAYKR